MPAYLRRGSRFGKRQPGESVLTVVMEEGSKNKKTIFVGGLSDDLDRTILIETFSTFGDIIDVQIPSAQTSGRPGSSILVCMGTDLRLTCIGENEAEGKHRGFAFITFATQLDAQDAIDNMDNNELR